MSISKYRVLMKVVELGSLTRAAEELGFTQSGVSHTINSLEDEFGFLLLTRSRSGVKLTPNGEQILKTIGEILKWNEHLEQEVASIHGMETGTIRIGTFTSVSVHWLPVILNGFSRDFPNIEVKVMEGNYRQIEDWIAQGKIDCGFLSLPTLDKLDVIPLKKDQMMVILPMDHPLSGQPSVNLAQLAGEPFIMPREGGDDDINRVLGKLVPNVKFVVADDYAIMAMVEQGLGVSILPELVLRGQHRQISIVGLGEFRSLGIAVNSLQDASPAVRKFLEYVKNYLL
ncbi:LysR family transcriptional regulator [Pseudoneobacillus sp. C159]